MSRESRSENSLYAPKVRLSTRPKKVYDINHLGRIYVSIRDVSTGHSTTARTKNLISVGVQHPANFDEYYARFVK